MDQIKNELMVFLFFNICLTNKYVLPKSTFLGSWDFGKKVQKGPEASKPIFSEGGWVNSEGGG